MTQELPGNFQTVVPGSADDPFTAHPGSGDGASANAQGAVPVSQPANTNPPQSQQQQVAPPAPAPTAAATAIAEAPKVVTVEEFERRIGGLQSAYDRRANALQQQLEAANEGRERAENDAIQRERAAITSRLDPEALKGQETIWAAEDRMRAVDKKESALMDLYRATEGQRLLLAYGDSGITEDDLVAYTGNPTGMEDYIKGLAFDRLKAGGSSAAIAANAVAAAARAAPPGANGQTDIGGGAAGYNPPQPDKGFGLVSMAANVKAMFSDGPALPW